MPNKDASFQEIGRLRVSDATEIVVSKVVTGGITRGINFNSYVTSPRYTGFTKGAYIPKDKMGEFKTLVEGLVGE